MTPREARLARKKQKKVLSGVAPFFVPVDPFFVCVILLCCQTLCCIELYCFKIWLDIYSYCFCVKTCVERSRPFFQNFFKTNRLGYYWPFCVWTCVFLFIPANCLQIHYFYRGVFVGLDFWLDFWLGEFPLDDSPLYVSRWVFVCEPSCRETIPRVFVFWVSLKCTGLRWPSPPFKAGAWFAGKKQADEYRRKLTVLFVDLWNCGVHIQGRMHQYCCGEFCRCGGSFLSLVAETDKVLCSSYFFTFI